MEYQRVIDNLIEAGYCIEETDRKDFGLHAGKSITNLIANPMNQKKDGIKAFLELRDTSDLLGYANSECYSEPKLNDEFFTKLSSCPKLQRLHLLGHDFNAAQLNSLGKMRELKTLILEFGTFPDHQQDYLSQLTKLVVLRLEQANFSFDDFGKVQMPELRFLQVHKCQGTELHLTKQGLGRFPKLITISLDQCAFRKVICESGTLPELRILDLAYLGPETEIDWDELIAAFPKLEAFGIHVTHYNAAMNQRLARLPHLKYLRVCNRTVPGFKEEDHDWVWQDQRARLYALEENLNDFKQLKSLCPDLKYCSWETRLFLLNHPYEYPYDFNTDDPYPDRASPRWNQRSMSNRRMH